MIWFAAIYGAGCIVAVILCLIIARRNPQRMTSGDYVFVVRFVAGWPQYLYYWLKLKYWELRIKLKGDHE